MLWERVPLTLSWCTALTGWLTRLLIKVLAQEYKRKLAEAKVPNDSEIEPKQLSLALKRIRIQEDRLIDAYKNEAIDLDQLKVEMGKLRARKQETEQRQKRLEQQGREQTNLKEGLAHLEAFCRRVSQGLQNLTFEEKQKLLRLVVDHVTLEGQKVCIHAVVPMDSPNNFASLCPRNVNRGAS
jgi:hypothetical protein